MNPSELQIEATKSDYAKAREKLSKLSLELAGGFPGAEYIARPEDPRAAGNTQGPRLKGFGYLYRRGTIWWIRYSVRGRDFRESSHSEREGIAHKLLKTRWQELGRGQFIGPSQERVTLEDLLTSLETEYEVNKRRSIGTLKGRLVHLRAAFGSCRAVDVNEGKIELYKQMRLAEKTTRGKKPVQPATINRELSMLRKAFRLGVRQKRIATAPTIDLLAENNVRQGFVEPADFDKIVAALPERLRDFMRFAYATGWRRGEISGLQWSAVNRQTKTIFLGRSKNGEPRILPLVGELDRIIDRRWQARSIKNHNGSTTLATNVFHCGDGRPIGDTRKSWSTACSKAGMPNLLVHDLRRSAVRNFDKNGVSQIIGMMISGHKTVSVYKRYRIVPENDIREALQKVEQAIEEQKKNRPVRTMTRKGVR
jgi:integrase